MYLINLISFQKQLLGIIIGFGMTISNTICLYLSKLYLTSFIHLSIHPSIHLSLITDSASFLWQKKTRKLKTHEKFIHYGLANINFFFCNSVSTYFFRYSLKWMSFFFFWWETLMITRIGYLHSPYRFLSLWKQMMKIFPFYFCQTFYRN